jgi:PAS domain S-box-containing protein
MNKKSRLMKKSRTFLGSFVCFVVKNYFQDNNRRIPMSHHNKTADAVDIRVCKGDIDYEGIVRHINDGVVIIREDTIVFANNAFYEISQRKPEQVISTAFSNFISAADQERVTRYCTEQLFTEGISDRIEFVMPKAHGEAIIMMKVSVVECGGIPAILGALTDITERRKTRDELQKMKARLESILHSMNEVVVSMSPDGCQILAINPAAEALYGVPVRNFISRQSHILSFVHPDDLGNVRQFYDNLSEAEFDSMQYRIIGSNKKPRWVLDEGHVVYSSFGKIRRIDHVIRDITEEKKAIDALRQSEAKYKNFFESTSDMAFTLTAEGDFIDINDAGLKLLGFENKAEALASNVKDFYVDILERTGLLEEIYGKGLVEAKHVKFRNKAGDVIEVAITSRARMDDSGNFICHEGIVHNISKALEDQRNRVVRNTAGSMCHYLNTHLMTLSGSKDDLSQDIKELNALVEKLASGESSPEILKLMQSLVEDILFFNEGIGKAYEKISEVTTAFNKAFLYKEESYSTKTILDIFKAYGYEENDLN